MYVFCSLSWVEVNGSTYKKSSVVVLHMDDVPTFIVIDDILVFHADMYYQVWSVLFTEYFLYHFHAFETHKQHPEEYVICESASLFDTCWLRIAFLRTQIHSLYHWSISLLIWFDHCISSLFFNSAEKEVGKLHKPEAQDPAEIWKSNGCKMNFKLVWF